MCAASEQGHRKIVSDPDALLSRELGIRQLAAVIFNYTVGSGIFALPAVVLATVGPGAWAAYVVCAVMMTLVVLCLAEAGSRVAATGGPYAYVGVALGPLVGFVAGILLLMSDFAAAAAVANLLAGSLAASIGFGVDTVIRAPLMIGALLMLAAVNIRGVGIGGRIVEIATVAKLIPLLAFVAVGAVFIRPDYLAVSTLPDFQATLRASGVLIFAFIGIEGALVPSGEVRNPARTVPRAALIALLAVSALYLSIQLVAQGLLGTTLAADRVTPLATAAASVAGPIGRVSMIAGAAISMLGFLSGAILAGPRSLFAFARDGFLPRRFAAVHHRYRTPHVAIVAYTAIAIALAVSGTFERLAVITSVFTLWVYLLCIVSTWMLRRRDVRSDGEPFRAPGGALVPILACASTLLLLFETATRRDLISSGAVVALALGLYAARSRRK